VKRDLGQLTNREHDVVVVGGGISGVTAAWDAAQRGLATALIEADDFGGGVSWNSLKTIHGGLRHLQRADIASLRESVCERRAMLRIAPQIVRPLTFLVPTYGHGLKGCEAMELGLLAYDLLSWDRNRGLDSERAIPRSRLLSRREVVDRVPGVPQRGLTGGALWTDAQVEHNERLVMGFVVAAAEAGAAVANRVEAVGLRQEGRRITGIRARDTETGESFDVRARMVINAAGPSLDAILEMAGIRSRPIPLLRATNLILLRAVVTSHAVGASEAGRFLFLVPWLGRTILGTAYEPAERPETPESLASFRADAQRAFPWAGLESEGVRLVHRGSVPGERDGHGLWSRSYVIDHASRDGVDGLISILAVKYTTARGLAERAVDRALARLGRPPAPCRTATTVLPAARPLSGTIDEQTRHAVEREMARSLADVVLRRTALGAGGAPPAEVLPVVVTTMSALLGWSSARVDQERQALLARFA
jgi:glycerol-3-phosphate dehydrogenase